MFGLFFSVALLGLSAVDPVGIAAMPILLLQPHPYRRSFIFLGGSLTSLLAFGLLFSQGLGSVVLRFEKANTWLVPSVEVVAGLVLVAIAAALFWRMKQGKHAAETPPSLTKRLQLHDWQLYVVGAMLVAVQSVIDVVFVVAMIRVGQLRLHTPVLVAAVATYAVTALLLQLAVVVGYKLTPLERRTQALDKLHKLLFKRADQVIIAISLVLAGVLFGLAAWQ